MAVEPEFRAWTQYPLLRQHEFVLGLDRGAAPVRDAIDLLPTVQSLISVTVAKTRVAIADLHRATGTALSRNRIDFVVPDVNQIEPGNRALDYRLDDTTDQDG